MILFNISQVILLYPSNKNGLIVNYEFELIPFAEIIKRSSESFPLLFAKIVGVYYTLMFFAWIITIWYKEVDYYYKLIKEKIKVECFEQIYQDWQIKKFITKLHYKNGLKIVQYSLENLVTSSDENSTDSESNTKISKKIKKKRETKVRIFLDKRSKSLNNPKINKLFDFPSNNDKKNKVENKTESKFVFSQDKSLDNQDSSKLFNYTPLIRHSKEFYDRENTSSITICKPDANLSLSINSALENELKESKKNSENFILNELNSKETLTSKYDRKQILLNSKSHRSSKSSKHMTVNNKKQYMDDTNRKIKNQEIISKITHAKNQSNLNNTEEKQLIVKMKQHTSKNENLIQKHNKLNFPKPINKDKFSLENNEINSDKLNSNILKEEVVKKLNFKLDFLDYFCLYFLCHKNSQKTLRKYNFYFKAQEKIRELLDVSNILVAQNIHDEMMKILFDNNQYYAVKNEINKISLISNNLVQGIHSLFIKENEYINQIERKSKKDIIDERLLAYFHINK